MYDVADSAFTTVIVTALYAPYFSKIVVGDSQQADFLWGLAASISEVIVAVLAPILGAIADYLRQPQEVSRRSAPRSSSSSRPRSGSSGPG